jgi:hypothetical protein
VRSTLSSPCRNRFTTSCCVPSSFQDISEWVAAVKMYAPKEANTFLVANKVDLVKGRGKLSACVIRQKRFLQRDSGRF